MHVSLDEACELLKKGRVIAAPTETVYGLAASLNQQDAIAEVFSIKGRPSHNPLIIHLSSACELSDYVQDISQDCLHLSTNFWPGPLTMILPAKLDRIPDIVRAGLSTAAFRVPSHPLARKLLADVGPLVMPSANLSGRPSSTSPEHVESDFGSGFPILNGGKCSSGVESTILMWKERWRIIRLGALSPEDFLPVLGYLPEIAIYNEQKVPLCPGQLLRHYAPKASLKLVEDFSSITSGVILGFSDRDYPSHCRLISFGTLTNPATVAQCLYKVLRQLDEEKIGHALVDINVPSEGLWLTLKERLVKAAQTFN